MKEKEKNTIKKNQPDYKEFITAQLQAFYHLI